MGEKNNNSTYKTEEGSDRVYQNVYKYEGYTIKSALSDALNGACLAPLCLLHLFFFLLKSVLLLFSPLFFPLHLIFGPLAFWGRFLPSDILRWRGFEFKARK